MLRNITLTIATLIVASGSAWYIPPHQRPTEECSQDGKTFAVFEDEKDKPEHER